MVRIEIRLSKQAAKYLQRLDPASAKRIKQALSGLTNQPMLGDIKVMRGNSDCLRLRIGKHRALFSVENNIIQVTRIAPRGEIYK